MAEKKNSEKIEDNLKAMLRSIDDKMERMTDGFDSLVKKGLEKGRSVEVIHDDACNVSSGALPVSVAMRAVDYGLARVALRVMPRMAEEFLVKDIKIKMKQIGLLVVAWTAAKIIGKKIPVVGDLTAILVGYTDEKGFNDRLQSLIRASLGCSPSSFDHSPMKYAINARMARTVVKDNKDLRVKKKVRTRLPHGSPMTRKNMRLAKKKTAEQKAAEKEKILKEREEWTKRWKRAIGIEF